MTFRVVVFFLAAALATSTAAAAGRSSEHIMYLGRWLANAGVGHNLIQNEEKMMESESARRQLVGEAGYISYAAMARDSVPCDQRGQSYYNCRGGQANPYQRGCTRATRCARSNR